MFFVRFILFSCLLVFLFVSVFLLLLFFSATTGVKKDKNNQPKQKHTHKDIAMITVLNLSSVRQALELSLSAA